MATCHVPTTAFAFGLLGNVVSFITFFAPLPTFYRIYKRKSTQGFQSIPYVVSLLSAMLMLYYGLVKKDTLLITINGIGCVIESAYVAAYLIYASKNDRMLTLKLFLSMNVLGYGAVLYTTFFLSKGAKRAQIIGWICMTFSLGVFAAPLCIMRKVIKTRSVEFMPITLSIFLTPSAIVWFFYGFLLKDFFIAVPNVLGFALGGVQMVLYTIYRKNAKKVAAEPNLPQQELTEEIIDVVKLSAAVCQEFNPVLAAQLKDVLKDSVGEDEQIVEMPSKTIKA
ncbi:bidirectional sugar transporter SWEET10-like [Eucalyptus grandis]|uniref:bidirectional sugar transporter SWEET10-like n=1 Tax=Eucalyptus grandis TaxID=71139 RepID=UPI00192F10C2|nr:bidirectional sugar transporter SWEET10-like [Eucalyptus grandis]